MLEHGEITVTGKPPLWMKYGDVCEVEVEKIGVLRNPVKAEK